MCVCMQIGLFAKISLQNCPNLTALLREGRKWFVVFALGGEVGGGMWLLPHVMQTYT